MNSFEEKIRQQLGFFQYAPISLSRPRRANVSISHL